LSSVRVLDNIFAAASELENRGGKAGRSCGLLLKNNGDCGWFAWWKLGGPKLNLSRKCFERAFSRGLLSAGSEVGGLSPNDEASRVEAGRLRADVGDVGGANAAGGGGVVEISASPALTLLPLTLPSSRALALCFSAIPRGGHAGGGAIVSFEVAVVAYMMGGRMPSGTVSIANGAAPPAACCTRFLSK